MKDSRFFIILGFIIIGIVGRLIPHPPNFTPINALALFGSCYLGNRWLAVLILLSSLFLSDVILGFHSVMPFVYLSFTLTIMMGWRLRNKTFHHIPTVCLASSFLFFFITNFGVWLTNVLYPKTLIGLEMCYLAAIPFLTNQLLGDLTYTFLLFGSFALWRNGFQLDKPLEI